MTPAESAVIADMLRGAKSDGVALGEETVARMLRAATPFTVDELADLAEGAFVEWRRQQDTNHPTWPNVVAVAMTKAFGREVFDSEVRARFAAALSPLSPTETPAGASVPRPQGSPHAIDNLPTNPALDPWHCVGCGARLCACPDGTARAPF